MRRWAAVLAVALAVPAAAQHAGHDMGAMPGMTMPAPATAPPGSREAPAATPADQPADQPASPAGTDQPAGRAAAPPPPGDHAADTVYDPAAMARSRDLLRREHGGMAFHRVFFNLAEWQLRRGRDGYRWDGEAWYGGDIDRVVVNTEGEGLRRDRLERGEVQALYSHAIDPYFDVQAGIRQDIGRRPRRSYATIGVEGLAPYWFEVEGRLFLSQQGELLGRVEATYDQLLTQRLVLQPRVELNVAAQDIAGDRVGRGLSDAELGLRLRYEFSRRFAPYAGLSWTRATGRSARYARAGGEKASARAVALGVRTWF